MKIKDILALIPDLDRDTLDYWERQEYIKAKWVKRGQQKVREYSPQQVKKIQLMSRYYKMGFSPMVASQKADDKIEQNVPLIKYFFYKDKPLVQTYEEVMIEQLRGTLKSGVFDAPQIEPPENSHIEQILQDNYLKLEPDSLIILAESFLDLVEDVIGKVDILVTIGGSASTIAGANALLAQKQDIFFPTIVPWEERERLDLNKPDILIFQEKIIGEESEETIIEVAKELEQEWKCEVKAIIAVLMGEESKEKISKEGYLIESLLSKADISRCIRNDLTSKL